MKLFLLIVSLGGILIAALYFGISDFDGSAMSLHGWIALVVGTVLSLALGGGLMALSFYSSRRGYDDRIEVDLDEDDRN